MRDNDHTRNSREFHHQQELDMHTRTVNQAACAMLGAAAVAFTLFAAPAAGYEVTISIPVSAKGLDLSQPADAQRFYYQLQHAATVACTDGYRVDLQPLENPKECYEQALAGAIRTVKAPVLTRIYLASHTVREAMARGIEIPAQLVAR